MQQFNMFSVLEDLRKLSCKENHENHFQRFLPFIIINLIIHFHLFKCNYQLLIFIIIIAFVTLNETLAACIFNQIFYFYLVLGFPRTSWNLVIAFVSRYLYVAQIIYI